MLKRALSLLALIALAACSAPKTRSVVGEVRKNNISVQSVLDLARSSYLKGCVDGKNLFASEIRQSAFAPCLETAKEHEAEIRQILEQNVRPMRAE